MDKYDGFKHLPRWKELELESMKTFVWCSSRLDEMFWQICKEVELSSFALDEVEHDSGIDEMQDSDSEVS